MKEIVNPAILLFLMLFLFSGFSCNRDNICTMEFVMITVTVYEKDNSIAEIDKYYVIKHKTSDTVPTNLYSSYPGLDMHGIILFTDNEAKYTDNRGNEFILHCYRDTVLIVNSLYKIKYNGCHVELVNGETEIFL